MVKQLKYTFNRYRISKDHGGLFYVHLCRYLCRKGVMGNPVPLPLYKYLSANVRPVVRRAYIIRRFILPEHTFKTYATA